MAYKKQFSNTKSIVKANIEMSSALASSDLAVIGLTGIGPIWKISVLDWFLPYWRNESFCIVLTDLIR